MTTQRLGLIMHGVARYGSNQCQDVADAEVYDNGFKIQWEHFIRHVVEDVPYQYTLHEGAKGLQLVEAALKSWHERRWIDVPALPTCLSDRSPNCARST